VASLTQKVPPSFFVFSAYDRKSKPPASQVVVDSNNDNNIALLFLLTVRGTKQLFDY
jgi:hypothetical protein